MYRYYFLGALMAWVVFSVIQLIGYKRGLFKKFSFIALTAFPVVATYFIMAVAVYTFVMVATFFKTLLWYYFHPVSQIRWERLTQRSTPLFDSVKPLGKHGVWFATYPRYGSPWYKGDPWYKRYALFRVRKTK